MKKFNLMAAAVVVAGLVVCQASGQTVFSEDFEGLNAGGLDGQNGWSADSNVLVDAGGAFSSNFGAKNVDGTAGNFSASQSLSGTISSGVITATALVNPSCGSCERGGSIFLSDGGSNVLEVQVLGGQNHPAGANSKINLIGPAGTQTVEQPYIGLVRGDNGDPTPSFNDALFVQVELIYDINSGMATGTVRDVLDFNGRPTTFGPDVFTDTFDAFTAFGVNTVGFRVATPTNATSFGGNVDDVSFIIPEPATGVLLGLVAVAALRRRRQA